LKLYPLR